MDLDDRKRLYTGAVDRFHTRTGLGEQRYPEKEGEETYHGGFTRDIYHGYGEYIADGIFTEPWGYEGSFRFNTFEGYGTLSFADGSVFSGLFKNDRPFGPGVLTYPGGKQDVGLWYGSKLQRLCVQVGSIDKLCSTGKDKALATRYKKLVKIGPTEEDDIAKDIFSQYSVKPPLLSQAYKLYSRHCKNPDSNLFDKTYLKTNIADLTNVKEALKQKVEIDENDPKSYINVDIMKITQTIKSLKTEESQNLPKEIFLLSWNNGNKIIDLMTHSFIHRKPEFDTQFDIGNVLCHRNMFSPMGEKELGSVEMLQASERNDTRTILNLLKDLKLNRDVMDSKGNSMILRAAAEDAHNVIKMLSEINCNIDAVNDEGFNALNHTLSRFLALKHNVQNWAAAFIPPYEEESIDKTECEVIKWLKCMRSSVQGSQRIWKPGKVTSKTKRRSVRDNSARHYLFSLQPAPPNSTEFISSKKSVHAAENVSKKSVQISTIREDTDTPPVTTHTRESHVSKSSRHSTIISMSSIQDDADEKKRKLKKMEKTLEILLDIGADVNASVTPAPLIVLTLFTGSPKIVSDMLEHGVNPNSRLKIDNGELVPLHVIVLAKPLITSAAIVQLLLDHGANPHHRTNEDYRWNFMEDLLPEGAPKRSSEGMNPLHALILRPDATYVPGKKHLENMCCILSWPTDQSQTYQGLSPIGLAILTGNLSILRTLLNCGKINVDKPFDEYWGNALTTYLRIHGTSSSRISYEMLDMLLNAGADPLNYTTFPKEGNLINFLANLKRKVSQRFCPETASIRSKRNRRIMSMSSIDRKNVLNFENKEVILKELAKKRVEQHIKGVLVRAVLYCMQKKTEEDPQVEEMFAHVMGQIGNWVEYEELADLIYKNLEISQFSDGMALVNAMLLFPDLFPTKKKELKKFVKSFTKSSRSRSRVVKAEESFVDYDTRSITSQEGWVSDIQQKISEIKKMTSALDTNKIKPPEIDNNGELYKVCYECLKRSVACALCPKCELVYFCSLGCNLKDVQNPRSKHKCRVVYWGLKEGECFIFSPDMKKKKSSHIHITIPKETPEETKAEESLKSVFDSFETETSLIIKSEATGYIRLEKSKTRLKPKSKIGSRVQSASPKSRKNKSKSSKKWSKERRTAMKKLTGVLNRRPSRKRYSASKHRGSQKKKRSLQKRRKGSLKKGKRSFQNRKSAWAVDMMRDAESRRRARKASGAYVEYGLLGEFAEDERYWDRAEENLYTLEERLVAYLLSLYELYGEYLDIDDYFPFVVYRLDDLFFKYYDLVKPIELPPENYSYN